MASFYDLAVGENIWYEQTNPTGWLPPYSMYDLMNLKFLDFINAIDDSTEPYDGKLVDLLYIYEHLETAYRHITDIYPKHDNDDKIAASVYNKLENIGKSNLLTEDLNKKQLNFLKECL